MKKKKQNPQKHVDTTDLSLGLDFKGDEWDVIYRHYAKQSEQLYLQWNISHKHKVWKEKGQIRVSHKIPFTLGSLQKEILQHSYGEWM